MRGKLNRFYLGRGVSIVLEAHYRYLRTIRIPGRLKIENRLYNHTIEKIGEHFRRHYRFGSKSWKGRRKITSDGIEFHNYIFSHREIKAISNSVEKVLDGKKVEVIKYPYQCPLILSMVGDIVENEGVNAEEISTYINSLPKGEKPTNWMDLFAPDYAHSLRTLIDSIEKRENELGVRIDEKMKFPVSERLESSYNALENLRNHGINI